MTRVERRIFIQASFPAIEAASVLSPHDWPHWYSGVEAVEVPAEYPQPGSVLRVQYRAATVSLTVQQTLVAFVPGESTVFKMDGMMSGTQSWTGYTEADGVWITAVMDYELRGDALAHMLDKVIIERVNARNLEDSLEALKRWVER